MRKLLELGPAAQQAVAGLYAWAVTVAPAAYGRQGGAQNWPATLAASLALVVLAYGTATARRTFSLFVFCAACVVTWMSNPDALSPVHLGMPRAVAGMVGWALYAYAWAAPVVEPAEGPPARIEAGPSARGGVAKGDAFYVLGAAVLALGLQLFGWDVEVPERAMFVRAMTLAAGVILLGLAGAHVATRHAPAPVVPPGKARVRVLPRQPVPFGWLVALTLLIVAGILYVLTA